MTARRAPPYRPVAVTAWQDMRGLSDDAKLLVLRLRTGPESLPIPGVVPVGPAALGESMGWSASKIARVLRELIEAGHVEADFKARLVWIPAAAADAPPQNPNVVLGWGRYVGLIPPCGLNGQIGYCLRALLAERGDPFVAAFDAVWSLEVTPNVAGNVPPMVTTNVSQIGGGSGPDQGLEQERKRRGIWKPALSAWEAARGRAKRDRPGRPIIEPDSAEDLAEFEKRLTEIGAEGQALIGAAADMFFGRNGGSLGDLFWRDRQWSLHVFAAVLPALLEEARAKLVRTKDAKEAEEQAEYEMRYPMSAALRNSEPRSWQDLAELLNVADAPVPEKHARIEVELARRKAA